MSEDQESSEDANNKKNHGKDILSDKNIDIDSENESESNDTRTPIDASSSSSEGGFSFPKLTIPRLLLVIASIASIAFIYYYFSKPISIVAGLTEVNSPDHNKIVMEGYVFLHGAVSEATVWAIGTDVNNKKYISSSVKTDNNGKFKIEIPIREEPEIKRIIINSGSRGLFPFGFCGLFEKKGEEILAIMGGPTPRLIGLGIVGLVVIFIFFIGGVVIGLINFGSYKTRKTGFFLSLVFASLLSSAMVFFTGSGFNIIGTSSEDEVLDLGFASIYKTKYSVNFPNDWYISLTEPPQPIESSNNTPTGFGAPMWVVFLSVIGTALFTIALIIREIHEPTDFNNDTLARDRMHDIAQHQFFILFSPLGGIFIFQVLLITGAVSNSATISITALGAGVSLNLILSQAVSYVERWMNKSNSDNSSVRITNNTEENKVNG